jgi:hypothetical protein
MQRLEARLTDSLITRGNDLGFQRPRTFPVLYHSILDHEERLTAVTNAEGVATESANTDGPSLLRLFLLKLTQLLSIFSAPLGYFEMLSTFSPVSYTIYDIGPQIICYSFMPTEMHPTIATFKRDLLIAKTQCHWIRITLKMTVAIGTIPWKLLAEHKPGKVSCRGW